MEKEIRDDGSVVVQGNLQLEIPFSVGILLRILKMPQIIPFFVLTCVTLFCSEHIVGIVCNLSQSEMAELAIMKPLSLLIAMMFGMFICYFCHKLISGGLLGFCAIVVATVAEARFAIGNPSINGAYQSILLAGCFIEGYLLQWWTIFSRNKAEEVYLREVDKQATEFYEKELLPEIEKVYEEQEK